MVLLYYCAEYSGGTYVAKLNSVGSDLTSNSGNPSFDNSASSASWRRGSGADRSRKDGH
jgi:hypothetical protein